MNSGIQYPDEHYLLRASLRGVHGESAEAKATLAVINEYERLIEQVRRDTDAILPTAPTGNGFSYLPSLDRLRIPRVRLWMRWMIANHFGRVQKHTLCHLSIIHMD